MRDSTYRDRTRRNRVQEIHKKADRLAGVKARIEVLEKLGASEILLFTIRQEATKLETELRHAVGRYDEMLEVERRLKRGKEG